MSLAAAILAELDDQALDRLAELLAPRLPRTDGASPWMNVAEAAEYLRCKPQRVYDLKSQGRLRAHADGGRPLFHRDDLDRYLRGA